MSKGDVFDPSDLVVLRSLPIELPRYVLQPCIVATTYTISYTRGKLPRVCDKATRVLRCFFRAGLKAQQGRVQAHWSKLDKLNKTSKILGTACQLHLMNQGGDRTFTCLETTQAVIVLSFCFLMLAEALLVFSLIAEGPKLANVKVILVFPPVMRD